MTKKWSSTRSMDGKTKRQASKAARREQYDPKFVAEILAAAAAPSEAEFDNIDDLLEYLNSGD